MPDDEPLPAVQRAVPTTMQRLVERWPNTSALDARALKRLYPDREFICGWRIPADDVGLPEAFIVAMRRDSAFELPCVGLERKPAACEIPHLESDGVFCLLPSSLPIRLPVTGDHAVHLVNAAIDAYREGKSGANHLDYITEFGTYWTLESGLGANITVWLKDFSQSRLMYAHKLGKVNIVAETPEDIQRWKKQFGQKCDKADIRKAAFIRLPTPIFPNDYPATSTELLRLLDRCCPDAVEVALRAVHPGSDLIVILCFEHDGQPVMGAAVTTIHQNFVRPVMRNGRIVNVGQSFLSGRNRYRVTATTLNRRLREAMFETKRATVVRADSDFLIRRTAGDVAPAVRALNVTVIGCGALGGTIAMLLAQAGVGQLTLLDADTLSFQNVGRHFLGGRYIGENKAVALAEEILTRYVDHPVRAIPKTWQDAHKEDQRVLEHADLIISAAGHWESEAELSSLVERGDAPGTIFTWLERFGLAGHAAFVTPEASIRWALNEFGEPLNQVATLPDLPMPREASCGAFYQPFASSASSAVATMAVELALAAANGSVATPEAWTWVGPYENILRSGAQLAPSWRTRLFDGPGFQKVFRTILTPQAAPLDVAV